MKTTGGTKTTYGAMTDRQSSLRALYNGSGLVQSFSYDAWGNRRNPNTGAALTTSELVAANSITSRGYTCHEHMDEFGLINMNARIYDPALGMFISVDPLAQEYYNTYPYAYCGGDPVNNVDPMGEDYWSTSNTDEINKFWTWLLQNGANATGSYTFLTDAWFRMGDEEFIEVYSLYGQQALTYNDKTNKLYSSYVTYENNEIVVNGVSTTAVGFSTNKNAFGFEEAYSLGMTSGGIYTGLNELSNVHNGRWKGKNGKWNKLSWGGNRYTGARRIAVNKANLYKGIGRGLFVIDIFKNVNDMIKTHEFTTPFMNIAISTISTFGGIPGMFIGGVYYYIMTFDSRPVYPLKVNKTIAPRDNTFVAPY